MNVLHNFNCFFLNLVWSASDKQYIHFLNIGKNYPLFAILTTQNNYKNGKYWFRLISQVFCCGLTHWGRVTHICIGNLTIIGSANGLLPGRHQALIWTTTGILSTGPLGTKFSEILIAIQTFSVRKMHLKMLSAKWQPSCLGLNVLMWKSLIQYGQWWPNCKHSHHALPVWPLVISLRKLRSSLSLDTLLWWPSEW